jgi:predicted O-linked N-acetylglucosamine transferase (SPINDLY family)
VQEAAAAAMPLLLLNLHSSREEQRLCARKMSRKVAADVAALPPAPRITSPQRLRVAYLSANFNAHPVAHAVARLFEEHDRSGFEVIGVSMGAEDGSAIGRRVRAAMDGWRDICALSDTDAASLLRDLGIDLAVDLMGHTESFRPRVLAARPAPVQVSFLGYPGTLGAPWIDYLIADRFVLPPEHVASYDEKVVWLPGCFLPGDAWQPPGTAPDRRELGLPTQGVVYGCFNTHRKITPDVFDQWMQVLRAVPDGVLWLRDAGEEPCANLRREAQRRGIDAQRLHFAPFVPDALHRARIAAMDVFLDTYPYTAHSTVREVLSAGVPLLTRTGDTFPSRVAGSMLHAAGLGQLVAGSPTEYVDRAIDLGSDRTLHEALSRRLRTELQHSTLFDTRGYARGIEAAYRNMAAGVPA